MTLRTKLIKRLETVDMEIATMKATGNKSCDYYKLLNEQRDIQQNLGVAERAPIYNSVPVENPGYYNGPLEAKEESDRAFLNRLNAERKAHRARMWKLIEDFS